VIESSTLKRRYLVSGASSDGLRTTLQPAAHAAVHLGRCAAHHKCEMQAVSVHTFAAPSVKDNSMV
jgi:hypothetical protein